MFFYQYSINKKALYSVFLELNKTQCIYNNMHNGFNGYLENKIVWKGNNYKYFIKNIIF